MTKAEFIKAVAEAAELTQKETKRVLEKMQDVAFAAMKEEDEVKLFDGVTLLGVMKEARMARNPMTGEEVEVPAKMAPKCKFGKACKDAINA